MSTPTAIITPAERTFRAHLERTTFQVGVDRGRWRLVDVTWPHAVIAVSAAPRPESVDHIALRFELTDYPQQVPTATPWNTAEGRPLDATHRPRGEIVGWVFRHDWESGRALYAPYDRVAITNGHTDWPTAYPGDIWNSGCDITFILKRVHRLLNSDDYLGTTP